MSLQGYQGQLFYGTAGSTANNQVTHGVTELNYDKSPQYGNTTHRGDGLSVPIVTQTPTAIDPTITFTMLNRPTNPALIAFRAAAATAVAIALRTKDSSTGKGFDGDVTLAESEGQPLAGEQTIQFTAKAYDGHRTPQLYV